MGSAFTGWWADRSKREQRLLAIMVLLMIIVFGWLLLVRPLIYALEEAKLRHGEAVVALAEARARTAALRPSDGRTAVPFGPIDALVSRTATEAGFTGARIAAQGPARVTVSIPSARAPAFFAWIDSLERQGLSVERLRATASPDRTLATEAVFAVRRP
jgi:general secretion pathway protein M